MRSYTYLRRMVILLAVCGLSSVLPAQILSSGGLGSNLLSRRGAVRDDATARRAAMKAWYGDYTPEYRQFLMEAAQRERERWGTLIPGNRLFMPARAAGNHWTNLGPTNATFETNGGTLYVRDSGRPAAIVIHPTDSNTIYNATAGGGVWKTTNGGTTWTPITEAIGSLSCGDLAMDPSNPNTLYLGLGDAFDGTGVGMFKTIDGGANWTGPVFLGSSTTINAVAVSSSNNIVVLAATNAGLYRSTNAGSSWTKVTIPTGVATDPYCWTLAKGVGTNWALSLESDQAATSGTGEVWYSSDDGATWTKATGLAQATVGITRVSLASAPSNRNIMYAMAAGYSTWDSAFPETDLADLYRSSDGGHTWTAMGTTAGYASQGGGPSAYPTFSTVYSNPNTDSAYPGTMLGGQAWYNQMILVDPSSSATFYVAGNLALVKVTSATTTPAYAVQSNWLAQYTQPYIHADFHAAAFAPDGTLYMGTDGGIFKRTSAASNTWTSDLNIGITSHLCYSVGSSPANTAAVISGLQDNGTRVRSSSTSTFNQTLGGDGFGSYIHQADTTQQIATLYSSRVYKSTDSGQTWTAATGISTTNTVFITKVPPGLADATGNTIYTSTYDTIYKSTNFGTSFTALGRTGLPAKTTAGTAIIRNFGTAPSAINTIGIAGTSGRVFLTTNNGAGWTTVAATAFPGNSSYMSYISFAKANASIIYVASVAPVSTANHLWKSSNGGSTWTVLDTNGGLPNGFPFGVPVQSIVEDPGDSQTLYAGTHLGVYCSINGGSTWARFGAGLPLVNVTDFYITPTSSLMRISTFGRGLWEFDASTVTDAITAPASDGLAFIHGSAISFTGTATDTGGGTLTYSWNFGDGGTATGASTSHAYYNYAGFDTTYYATLTVTSSAGGSASATRSVVVHTAPPATAIALSYTNLSASPITFTAVGSGSLNTPPAGYKYQWWKRLPGQTTWTMVQDFGSGTFVLTGAPGTNYGVGVDCRTSAYPKAPNNWDVFTAVNFFNIVTGPIVAGGGSEPAAAPASTAGSPTKGGAPLTFEQFLQLRRQTFGVPGMNQTEPKSQE